MRKCLKAQSGNALFLIIIAVMLFGALGFAVSGMMRGTGGKGASEEQAKIYAAEIVQYAQTVKDTIRNLQISNDCADDEISFENAQVSGYEHPMPVREECKLFDASGGGILFQTLNEVNTATGLYFTGASGVRNVGTNEHDLLMVVFGMSDEVCKMLNKQAKIANSNTIQDDNVGYSYFTGAYAGSPILIGDTATDLEGKSAGCYYHIAANRNEFFYVLIAR